MIKEEPEKGRDNPRPEWGSDAVAEMLSRLEIEFVALNPGASFRGLHDSIVNYLGNKVPQILLTLHEEHAVSIAHGYAKVTERPMGVILHTNVGLMHATMPIFNVWCDRVPMIVLGATGPVDAARRRPWIDWIHTAKDQGALLRDYTKWDDQPGSVSAALESILRASLISQTSPKGPTYICLDVSMQEDRLEKEITIPDPIRFMPAAPSSPPPEILEKTAECLLGAEKPLIFMGRVSRSQKGWKERIRLAEMLGARVLTNDKVGAAFPSKHPLHLAMTGLILSRELIDEISRTDLILSLDWVDLSGTLKKIWEDGSPGAKIIHCSLDSHSHKGWSMDYFGLPPVDIPVLAEPHVFVHQLLDVIEKMDQGRENDRPSNAGAGEETGSIRSNETVLEEASGPIRLRDVGLYLNRATGDRDMCIIHVPIGWPGDVFDLRNPLDYLGGLGGAGLGAGPGMSVGAALALRSLNRFPVSVLGDGDFLMGVTALWTAAHYGIPLLIIVANNHSYGNSEAHQGRVAKHRGRPEENRWIGTHIKKPAVDICAISSSQGVKAGGPVEDLNQLHDALAKAIEAVDAGSCYVLDVTITGK